MRITNYFAFVNALESIEYYKENFAATLVVHTPVPEEMKEQVNLESVEGSTYSATITIFEHNFQISDRFDFDEDFTGNFNVLVDFDLTESEKFYNYIEILKNVECIYSNLDQEDAPYKMYRVRDKYGIIWSLVMGIDESNPA